MICYKRCSEVKIDLVYEAFQAGFSDYIIKFNISRENFIKRFFGPEGNSLEHSFIAIAENEAIGIILGGIKVYEDVKTMRCGALALSTKYRGQGIGNKLFELHKEEARKNKCKQLFLEVIVGNNRAIRFYEKLGYERIYDISYFTFNSIQDLKNRSLAYIDIKSINFEEAEELINELKYFHTNWQNDVDYIKKSDDIVCYGAYKENEIVGCICVNSSGKISLIIVKRNFRGKGIASSLLNIVCEKQGISKLMAGFPNNSLLEGFYKHLGFKKDALTQYEMYLTL